MKKYIVISAGLCLAMSLASCKSGESAYKKAYEKAKSQEASMQTTENTNPVTTTAPVVTTPSPQAQSSASVDNASVRNEAVVLIDGTGLKNFSVVVGSFGMLSNAQGVFQKLKENGYDAQIVKNEAKNMFRVVASTFDKKADAVSARDAIRGSQFNPNADAWLLYNAQ